MTTSTQDEILGKILSEITEMKWDISSMKSSIWSLESDVSSLKSDVGSLKSDVGSLKSDMSSVKSDIGSLRSEMHTGFRRLEELVLDTRDEMRSENAANRTLVNQAFTHISDQLAREGDMDFLPKYPRSK